MNTLPLATDALQRWFNLLFPPAMILFPAVYILAIRTVLPESADPEAQRTEATRWRRWLLGGTALCLAIHFAVFSLWSEVPQANFTWVLFFPLWFGPGIRLMRAKRPSLFQAPTAGPTRAASLASRAREVHVPPPLKMVAFAIWIALTVTALILAWSGQHRGLKLPFAGVFSSGGLLFLAVFEWASRCVRREPEPRDPGGSSEIDAAYARLRHRRTWAFFALGVVGMLTFNGFALASVILLPEHGGTLGLWGGIVGTAIGIAGGVLGGVLGSERARITARLQELQEQG